MRRTLAALAILLVLTGAFFWKLTLTREWTVFEASDLAVQVRPWLDFQAREFHAGRFPLWDPYEWAGHTLIGQVQPGVANPLNWILFAMPLRELPRPPIPAAPAAELSSALSPAAAPRLAALREGHIPFPTLHWYWVLIHWLAAVFAYALCRDLGAGFVPSILGGCIFGLTAFMGHTDWPQILMPCIWIPVIVLFFLRVVRDHRPLASATLCGAAMGMAFLGGHHVVPTFTAVLLCFFWLAHLAQHRNRVPHFAMFLLVTGLIAAVQVLPALEYSSQAIRWAGGPAPTLPGEAVPYSVHAQYSMTLRELPALILPIQAVHVNPHIGITAIGLALFALIVLFRRHPAVHWLAALTLGGILIAIARDFPPYWLIYRFVPMVEKAREPAFAIVLAQAGIAILAALGLSRLPRGAAPIALVLFFGEAVSYAPHFNRFDRTGSYLQLQQSHQDIIDFLKSQPGWFRIDFDDADVPYNAGDLYGLEQFGAAVSSMPIRTHRVLGHEDTPRTYGIRYHVGRKPSHPAQIEVFQSRSGLRVFLDPRIGEPMWSLHEPPCAGQDRFRVLSRLPQRTVIQADLACPGLTVIGDPYYRGWRAFVDGRRVPVQEVDGVRAVRTDAGHRTIEFVYHPATVYWGFALTLLGAVLAASIALHDFSNTRTVPHRVCKDSR